MNTSVYLQYNTCNLGFLPIERILFIYRNIHRDRDTVSCRLHRHFSKPAKKKVEGNLGLYAQATVVHWPTQEREGGRVSAAI